MKVVKPARFKYGVVVPYGFKGAAQDYCRRVFGPSYAEYNTRGMFVEIHENAKWMYTTKDDVGTLWFLEDGNESILSLVMIKKG